MPAREPRNEKPGLRPIGGLMPSISSLGANLASMKDRSTAKRTNTEITPECTEERSSIGTKVSIIGYGKPPSSLAEAQALLANAMPGQVDAAIPAWLPLSVSSRIAVRHYDGPNDPFLNYSVVGYDLADGFDEDDGREGLRLLEMLNARAEIGGCLNELGRLKVNTSSRNMSQDDLKAQIAIYAEELTEYPIDVVRDACRWWGKWEKWFPAWAELREICDERVMKRRAILTGLRRYFANKEQME